MSKHGFYNSFGVWVEEPCNAYCVGSHHAIVAYAGGDEGIDWIASVVEHDNPTLRVFQVYPAAEAPPCPTSRDSRRGRTVPVVMVFSASER